MNAQTSLVNGVSGGHMEFQMDVNKFKKHCAELRIILENIWRRKCAGQHISTTGTFMHLKGLKELNRNAQTRLKAIRDKTQEEKLKIDQDYLRLQNLQYETLHLQSEIESCLSFKTRSEEIQLISEEEFFTEAPSEFTDPASTKNDHLKMIARLAWEMEKRKEYEKTLSKLKQSCQDEREKIVVKRMRLAEVHPHLSKLVELTQPTKEVLDFDYYALKEEESASRLLPSPLYIIFSQVKAYAQVKDASISILINGDLDKAKHFKIPKQSNFPGDTLKDANLATKDGEDVDGEEIGSKEKKRKHRNVAGESQKKYDDSLIAFPLTLHLKTEVDGSVMTVEFSYYPQLGIITVTPKITLFSEIKESLTDVTGVILSEDHILDNLYPYDNGNEFPFLSTMMTYQSLVSAFVLRGDQSTVQSFSEYYGCPYRWAQALAGLCGLSEKRDEYPLSEPRPGLAFGLVEEICNRLRRRLTNRLRLFKELRAIERGFAGSTEELRKLKPPELEGKKCTVKFSSYDSMLLHPSSEEALANKLMDEYGVFYSIEVLFAQTVIGTMDLYIPMEYPERLPVAFVSMRNRASVTRDTMLVDIQLLNLERAINVNVSPSREIVEFMYITFLVGMQAYVSVKSSSESGKENNVLRARKYPDRLVPFHYMKKMNLFVHH